MKDIIALIELPTKNYTNGISESNLRFLNELKKKNDILLLEDKPFYSVNNYFISKVLSITNFIYNYFYLIFVKSRKLFRRSDFLYMVLSVNTPLGITRNLIQVLLLKPFAKKLVIHIHRSDIKKFENKLFFLINIFQNYILKISYKIIILSEKIYLIKSFDKSLVLKNSIDYNLEKNLLSLNYDTYSINQNTKFFFYSNILISKGIGLYLDLFDKNEKLNPFNSSIAGYPINKRVVKYALSKNHNYLGFINDFNKVNLFSNNHCLIFPSLNEGAPLVILEAMASGVFIISTNVGFIPELLGEDYPFMCSPNINELSILVNKFFELSSSQKIEIISNLRKRYIKLFTFDKWSYGVQRIFQ